MEFDASAERQRVMDEIRRFSSTVPDYENLVFRNLGNTDEK